MSKLRKGVSRSESDTGYWSRLHRDGMHAKHFRDADCGGRFQAYEAACKHQDYLEHKYPRKFFHPKPHKHKKDKLPVGVYHTHTVSRSGKTIWKYAASWTDPKTGKRHVATLRYDRGDPDDRAKKRKAAIKLRRSKEREIEAYKRV